MHICVTVNYKDIIYLYSITVTLLNVSFWKQEEVSKFYILL